MEAKTNKLDGRFVLLGLVLFACGMAAGALWDLPLDKAVYRPASALTLGMEAFGYYPIYLPLGLWLAYLARGGAKKLWLRVLCAVLALAGCAGLALASYGNLDGRGAPLPALTTALVWAALAAGAAVLLRSRADARRLRFAFFWGSIYLALDRVFIDLILKQIWDRTRFDDMLAAGSFADFTAWYQHGHGGTSFPSGHTSAACGVLVLLLLCDVFPAWARRRRWVRAGCAAYVVLMAACRLVIGRHFLSDTVMGAAVMAVLFLCLTRSAPYRRGLAKVTAALNAPPPAAGPDAAPAEKPSAG